VVAVFIDECWEPESAVRCLREYGERYDTVEDGEAVHSYCLRKSGAPDAFEDVTDQIPSRPVPAEREAPGIEYLWILSKRGGLSRDELREIAAEVYGESA